MLRVTFLATCTSARSPGCGEAAGRPSLPRRTRQPPRRRNAEMPSDPYLAEVTKFRQDREATLKGNAGWLTIAGLWFLTQPQTTFGSDPLNDIVFPASAPPRAGTFELRNGKVTVKAAEGVTFQLDGKPVTTMELKSDVPGPADRLTLGRRSAVLGAQQRRASVDSPARSEQLAAKGLRRVELVPDRSGVSRRSDLYALRQAEDRRRREPGRRQRQDADSRAREVHA